MLARLGGLALSSGFPPVRPAPIGCKVKVTLFSQDAVGLQPFVGESSPYDQLFKRLGIQCGYNKVDSPGHRPDSTLHRQCYQHLLLQMRMALPDCHLAPKDTLCAFAMLDTREARASGLRHRLVEVIFLSRSDWSVYRSHPLYYSSLVSPHSFFPSLWLTCVRTSNLKEGLFFPNSWDTSGRKGGEGK